VPIECYHLTLALELIGEEFFCVFESPFLLKEYDIVICEKELALEEGFRMTSSSHLIDKRHLELSPTSQKTGERNGKVSSAVGEDSRKVSEISCKIRRELFQSATEPKYNQPD
jgi:hypothetical protein